MKYYELSRGNDCVDNFRFSYVGKIYMVDLNLN